MNSATKRTAAIAAYHSDYSADAPLALRFNSRESDYGILTLSAELLAVASDGTPRNIHDPYQSDPLYAFSGIVATAQASVQDIASAGDAPEYSYAWRFGLRADGVASADRLAATLAVLRAVEKRLSDAESRFGTPRTFGAYVARVADALAVPVMFGNSGGDGWYTSGEWSLYTSGDAAGRIDDTIRRFRRPA